MQFLLENVLCLMGCHFYTNCNKLQKPQTMDALFAKMQKQRRTNPQLTSGPSNTNSQVVQLPFPRSRHRHRSQQQQPYQQQRRPYHPDPVYK
jgi:hypothetical protein